MNAAFSVNLTSRSSGKRNNTYMKTDDFKVVYNEKNDLRTTTGLGEQTIGHLLFLWLSVLNIVQYLFLTANIKPQQAQEGGRANSTIVCDTKNQCQELQLCSGNKEKHFFNQSTGRKGMTCFVCSQVVRKLAIQWKCG